MLLIFGKVRKMSAILLNEKRFYRKVLVIETLILAVISVGIGLFSALNTGLSFISGCFCAFLPQALFVYWIFFRNSAKNVNKMTAFYRGEGLKWLATIVLIGVVFRFYVELHAVAFFAGYFLGLLGNIVVPMVLKHRAK